MGPGGWGYSSCSGNRNEYCFPITEHHLGGPHETFAEDQLGNRCCVYIGGLCDSVIGVPRSFLPWPSNSIHKCTGGLWRLRVLVELDLAFLPPTETTTMPVAVTLFEDTRTNNTDHVTHETITWNKTYTNDYTVTMGATAGVEGEVKVAVGTWPPVVTEAKFKAMSGVSITDKTSKTDTFTVAGTSMFDLKPCDWVKYTVTWATVTATVTQPISDRTTCNNQSWNAPQTTDCNVRYIRAVNTGTQIINGTSTGGHPCIP